MRSSVLQKLLDKKKQDRFGDAISCDRWDELLQQINSGATKFDDIIGTVVQNGKIMSLFQFLTSQEPTQFNLTIISKVLNHIDSQNLEGAAENLRGLVLNFAPQAAPVIDLIVKCFMTSETNLFAELLNGLISTSPRLVSTISASISKYFPQTTFEPLQQINYMRNSLCVCNYSSDVTLSILSRIFQHLVALDCELLIGSRHGQTCEIDEDIAALLSPQLLLVFDFIEENPESTFKLLLQLFDLYLLDIPTASAVQFLVFHAASFDSSLAMTLVGFLLAKLIETTASLRTRANAALYLCTLIARARYIEDVFAAAVLDYVADFAQKYVEHVSSEAPELLQRSTTAHGVFYYSLQCVAYVLCWRCASFQAGGVDVCQRWKLDQLFNNSLDGLTCIDRNTAEMFVQLGVCECGSPDTVMDRLDVWFPFDPCPLEDVAGRVAEEYREWGEEEPTDLEGVLDMSLNRIMAARGINFDEIMQRFASQEDI